MSFLEIFQPGLKYLREEKERQKMLVSKPTHGGGAPLGIDLDAGTAKITIAPKADGSSRTGVGEPDDLGRQSRDVQPDSVDHLDADNEVNRVTDEVTRQQ
jgi:Family of unknown function (DUF6191)